MCELADRLENTYSGILYDVMRSMGHPDCVLPEEIRPLLIDKKIAGRIFTMSGSIKTDISEEDTLLSWCKFLSKAPGDTVIVCQPNDGTVSHMGELSSETLAYKKVRGYIVDGGCRDSAFIKDIGFQVCCKYYTPRDIVSRWTPDSYEQPIEIGGLTIHNGDYIMSDRDGTVVIPADIAEAVTAKAEELIQTENLVRKAILQGVDPVDAYLEFRKF